MNRAMMGLFLVLSAGLTANPAFSGETKVTPGGGLEATNDLGFTLKSVEAEKKPVELHLRDGKSFKGVISEVGDHYVVLGRLSGKELYGAKIRLEAIDAVELRTSDH